MVSGATSNIALRTISVYLARLLQLGFVFE